ncbi:MAG TPA: hypothetical protein PK462_10105, partial [Lachnospira sp.]|nr:hypothetical protein [Lachnospira sp.]
MKRKKIYHSLSQNSQEGIMQEMNGQIALVTGAGRGIGSAIAGGLVAALVGLALALAVAGAWRLP